MHDAERYQREFDQLLRETEDAHKRAAYLQGVDRIEQLFTAAASVGITQATAWQIIDANPADPKSGLRTLIQQIRERSQ